MNDLDIYNQIVLNTEDITQHNTRISLIEQNFTTLENNVNNHLAECITQSLVLNAEKLEDFNPNEIYNAEYVQSKFNTINSNMTNLITLDTIESKNLINKLTIIPNSITPFGVEDIGEEEFLCFDDKALATQNYVTKVLENLTEENIFSLETETYDPTDTTAAVCGKIVNSAIQLAIENEITDTINSIVQDIPGRYRTYSDIPYINFGNDAQAMLFGSFPQITSNIKFAIGNGTSEGSEHNLFYIDNNGIYYQDKKVALDVDKVNLNNIVAPKIIYQPESTIISSIELSDSLTLENNNCTIVFNGLNKEITLSDLTIMGLSSNTITNESDESIAVSIGALKEYINPLNKMDTFGIVDFDETNSYYSITSENLKINEINFNNQQISGIADLEDGANGDRVVNKNYVNNIKEMLEQTIGQKQNQLAIENYTDDVLTSALFTIPLYLELNNMEDINANSIINVEYLNTQLLNKQDKIFEINNNYLTLLDNNSIITNLQVIDVEESSGGNIVANKNYVDSNVEILLKRITELEEKVAKLETPKEEIE